MHGSPAITHGEVRVSELGVTRLRTHKRDGWAPRNSLMGSNKSNVLNNSNRSSAWLLHDAGFSLVVLWLATRRKSL
jgi:hypothetical protein